MVRVGFFFLLGDSGPWALWAWAAARLVARLNTCEASGSYSFFAKWADLRRAALSAAVSGWAVCGLVLGGYGVGAAATGALTCDLGRSPALAGLLRVHRRRKPSLARLKRLVTAPRTGRCLVFGCVELVYSYFFNCCGVSG